MEKKKQKQKSPPAKRGGFRISLGINSWFLLIGGTILGAMGLSELLRRLSRGDIAHLTVLAGDGAQHVEGPDFRGGFAASIAGNATLDLRDVQPQVKPVTLILFCLAGNLVVQAPPQWGAVSKVTGMMHVFNDARPGPPKGSETPPELEVFCLGLFGNVHIQ